MVNYCLTGINRITGERERVSQNMTKPAALERLRALKAAARSGRLPYTWLRVQPSGHDELCLDFKSFQTTPPTGGD